MYKQLVLLPLPQYMENKCCMKMEWCCRCHSIWKTSVVWKWSGVAAATVYGKQVYENGVVLPLPQYMENKCCMKMEWCCRCHSIWKMSLGKVNGVAAATVWKVFSAVAGNGHKGCPQKQLLRTTRQKGNPSAQLREPSSTCGFWALSTELNATTQSYIRTSLEIKFWWRKCSVYAAKIRQLRLQMFCC